MHTYGLCKAYIVSIGQFEWVHERIVRTEIQYYISEVIEPSLHYKIQQLGLKVVKLD